MSKKDPQVHVYPDPDGATMSVLAENFLEASTSTTPEPEEEVVVAGSHEHSS
jgi:hypothetical protein